MSYRDERPRGVMVDKIDTDKLTEIVRKISAFQYGKENPELSVWEDLVIGFDPTKDDWRDGNAILICSEGVGWETDEYGLLPVPTWVGFANAGMTYVSASVIKSLITGEQVDLAEHIDDRHKDRLERNFSIWYSLLSKQRKIA